MLAGCQCEECVVRKVGDLVLYTARRYDQRDGFTGVLASAAVWQFCLSHRRLS